MVCDFDAGHSDLIHDISFNYYGNRMTTCSSDQRIKVWNLENEQWVLCDSWKAHDRSINLTSAVLKANWAHPEYGNIICSCSFDRTIRIWEEQLAEPLQSGRRFAEKSRLGDFKVTAQDVNFAPRHLGLKVATCAADGVIRIYEAMDPMNLNNWTLTDTFEIGGGNNLKEPDGQYCLSWCTSKFHPPMLVVGTIF